MVQNSINFPDDLYDRLRESAAVNRRSIQNEVLVLVANGLGDSSAGHARDELLYHLRRIWRGEPPTDAESAAFGARGGKADGQAIAFNLLMRFDPIVGKSEPTFPGAGESARGAG